MTTSPSRLLKIHYVLRSLDLHLIDSIFITLPLTYKRKEKYLIPVNLVKEFPKIKFLSITQDLGPIIKGVSAIEYLKSVKPLLYDKDLFILLDDDTCYALNTIDTLVYYSLLNPNSPIGGFGTPLSWFGFSDFGYPYAESTSIIGNHISGNNLIEGYVGILFRGYHVDIELFKAMTRRDLNTDLSSCFLCDDLVMSYILSFNNFLLLTLTNEFVDEEFYGRRFRKDFNYFEDENALHLLNPDESVANESTFVAKYRICYQTILKYFLDFTKENLPFRPRDEVLNRLYKDFAKERLQTEAKSYL